MTFINNKRFHIQHLTARALVCLRYGESTESDTGFVCYNRAAILILNQMTNAQYHHSVVISQEAAAIPICTRTCLSTLSAWTTSSLLSISAGLSSGSCSQPGSLSTRAWLVRVLPLPYTICWYRLCSLLLSFIAPYFCPGLLQKTLFTAQEGPIFLVLHPLFVYLCLCCFLV